MVIRHFWKWMIMGLVLGLVLAGCGKEPSFLVRGLDPKAPAASSLPPLPGPDQPSPLLVRVPFGLYAEPPNSDTLQTLATGAVSPDGRFRAAVTGQGLWVARIDGLWLWQVQPQAATFVGWTPLDTLLLQDHLGVWLHSFPESATIVPLPSALQGKEGLHFSPDGTQVLYYAASKTGPQLWLANADGSAPLRKGENLVGWWDQSGQLVIRKVAEPPI